MIHYFLLKTQSGNRKTSVTKKRSKQEVPKHQLCLMKTSILLDPLKTTQKKQKRYKAYAAPSL